MKGTLLGIPVLCTAVCAFGQSLPLKEGLWETSMMASQNITSHDMTNRGFERQSTPREEL